MSHYIQSIERAARVLAALSEGGQSMGVTEIANEVGLGKSTVHRILMSLIRSNLVRLDPVNHRYSLGYGLLQLTAGLLRGSEVSITALPYLRDLQQETGETVSLNVRDNDNRTVVERLDTAHEIRYVAEIGKPLPLHVGAGGKAILAFMDEAEMQRLPAVAKMSATQIQGLVTELKEIRSAGSAYTLGERLPGAGSISAPVFNLDDEVIASVNVLCLESRLDSDTVRDIRRLVKATAMEISRELGWKAVGSRRQRANQPSSHEAESRRASVT